MGVVAASALAYPLLVCAVQLVVAQLFTADVAAVVLWLTVGVACSVAAVLSPWLLLGLVPPALFELWLVWPRLAA